MMPNDFRAQSAENHLAPDRRTGIGRDGSSRDRHIDNPDRDGSAAVQRQAGWLAFRCEALVPALAESIDLAAIGEPRDLGGELLPLVGSGLELDGKSALEHAHHFA